MKSISKVFLHLEIVRQKGVSNGKSEDVKNRQRVLEDRGI